VAKKYARSTATADNADIKLIAFYLTQFHPVPENDKWWGKGFTEWTNATKAQPLFPGHYQPHLPSDFGFYDLRVRATRHDQIEVARNYGIGGFCYYYYWFSGKRILHEPLDDMLADNQSRMPFCLCWANENWTRRWDAAEHEILLAQKYEKNDDLDFIKSVAPFMKDKRYIRHNGGPLLLVYRPQHLPDARKSAEVWRKYCKANGLGDLQVFCCFTHSNWDYRQFGFDGGVEFPPHNMVKPSYGPEVNTVSGFKGYIFDLPDVAEMYLERGYEDFNAFRSVFPAWDNTARRNLIGAIGLNGTPENYEYWLSEAIRRTRADYPGQERFVFINAWNEWAEGCHLEPDRKHGRAFLEATARAASGQSALTGWTHRGVPAEAKLKVRDDPWQSFKNMLTRMGI
jgi:lipopolysaccharide biosynthesis protein